MEIEWEVIKLLMFVALSTDVDSFFLSGITSAYNIGNSYD